MKRIVSEELVPDNFGVVDVTAAMPEMRGCETGLTLIMLIKER